MKAGPTILQSLPPPNAFSVPTQAPPPSLLQAQLSAASLAPLLQNPPQPLLPQPPPKGKILKKLHSCIIGYRPVKITIFAAILAHLSHVKAIYVVFLFGLLSRGLTSFPLSLRCVFWGSTSAPSENDATAAACTANWAPTPFPQSQWSRPWAHPQV